MSVKTFKHDTNNNFKYNFRICELIDMLDLTISQLKNSKIPNDNHIIRNNIVKLFKTSICYDLGKIPNDFDVALPYSTESSDIPHPNCLFQMELPDGLKSIFSFVSTTKKKRYDDETYFKKKVKQEVVIVLNTFGFNNTFRQGRLSLLYSTPTSKYKNGSIDIRDNWGEIKLVTLSDIYKGVLKEHAYEIDTMSIVLKYINKYLNNNDVSFEEVIPSKTKNQQRLLRNKVLLEPYYKLIKNNEHP